MTTQPLPRPDWRESVSLAADLALLGIVVVVSCLPVVTAGAVLATASAAVDHACTHRAFPGLGRLGRTLRRAMLAGLGAATVGWGVVALLALDLIAVRRGAVPGGAPVFALSLAATATVLAVSATIVARVGQTGAVGWRAATRWSLGLLAARPLTGLAIVAMVAVLVGLAALMPVLVVVLPGFVLFGLHVIVRRAAARFEV